MRMTSIATLLIASALLGNDTQAQAPQPGYSAAGLYNLANSYARAGQLGMAVLNYERAALLAPEDADIQANLTNVRAAAHLPPRTSRGFDRIVQFLRPTIVAWIGVLGLIGAGACMLAGKRSSRHRALRAAGIIFGIAAVAFTVGNAWVQWPKLREAVVIVKETGLRVSPAPMGDELLRLPEAETVTVTAEHEDFVLVRTSFGRRGWAARADVADVIPRPSVR